MSATETRAALALPAVAAVVALPAVLPRMDIPIGSHVLIGERLVYLPATVGLGLWFARRGSLAADAIVVAGLACLWLLPAPRGWLAWSYSWPDMALVLAVGAALAQLALGQKRLELTTLAVVALSLWVVDGLLLSAFCGAVIHFEFSKSTACGSAFGDLRASVPALLGLAAWLFVLRRSAS